MADDATRSLALQTLDVLATRRVVADLARRYQNSDNAQRAGHLFEVMHALSYTEDAIERGSSVRAVVTEWAAGGSQTAPSDIDLQQGSHLVGEAQAKLYDSVSHTAHQVARNQYDGMQRLVAEDRYEAVQALLDRKVNLQPDSVNSEHYRDAHAYITDALRHGDIHSDPVTYGAAQQAAQDPDAWIDDEAREAVAQEIITGVATAGGVAAAVQALVAAASAVAKVRAGEVGAVEAAITACASAARTGARSMAAGGIGEGIELGAHVGLLIDGLGAGTLPMALGRAAAGIAEAAFAFAQGDIDEAEFALRTAETAAKTTTVWAFAAISQTVIPVPVVGALVGGFVGQVVGVQAVKGLQMALVAARADQADEQRLRELERQLLIATALTEELAASMTAIGHERNTYLSEVVMPQVGAARRALLLEDPDEAIGQFAELIDTFGGRRLFSTMAEFEDWMARDVTLELDGNWR